MDNKKILRFGTIAAVVLIVLFGITVLIDDTPRFPQGGHLGRHGTAQ